MATVTAGVNQKAVPRKENWTELYFCCLSASCRVFKLYA